MIKFVRSKVLSFELISNTILSMMTQVAQAQPISQGIVNQTTATSHGLQQINSVNAANMPLIQQQTPNTAIQPAAVGQMQTISSSQPLQQVTAPSSGSCLVLSTTQLQTSLPNQMIQKKAVAPQGFQGWSGQQLHKRLQIIKRYLLYLYIYVNKQIIY